MAEPPVSFVKISGICTFKDEVVLVKATTEDLG
jgi:hypothetical protein